MSDVMWYLAHPVGAPTQDGIDENLRAACVWYSFLLEVEPEAIIVAPWLGALLGRVQDDRKPHDRARGFRDNVRVAARLGGIILCGGRLTNGMNEELGGVVAAGGRVSMLLDLGPLPPRRHLMAPGLLARGEDRWKQHVSGEWTWLPPGAAERARIARSA